MQESCKSIVVFPIQLQLHACSNKLCQSYIKMYLGHHDVSVIRRFILVIGWHIDRFLNTVWYM